MGSLCAKPAPPKVYDPNPDKTTGLTEKDREMIQESWKLIANRKAIKQNAVEFFMMLFTEHPHIKDYFEAFKNKEMDELRNSPRMKAHAASVFYFIESYVENAEDADTLVNLVDKMSRSHVKRGIPVSDFEKLRRVFLEFLRKTLGDMFTAQHEEAWDKLLMAQNALYAATLEELRSEEVVQSGEVSHSEETGGSED